MPTHPRSGAKPVCALALLSLSLPLTAADRSEGWDHLLMVDFAPKAYRIRVDHAGYARWDERGTFDSHVAISPTLRFRADSHNGEPAMMVILGLAYEQYSSGDLQMEVVEWQMGAGAWWPLNEWSEFSLHAQIGTGQTYVDLPDSVNQSSGRKDGWSDSANAGILAMLAFHPHPNVAITLSGGVSVMFQYSDVQDGSRTTFSNVISGGVLGAGIGLTF